MNFGKVKPAISHLAAVGMRCMINHVEGKLELLEKELH